MKTSHRWLFLGVSVAIIALIVVKTLSISKPESMVVGTTTDAGSSPRPMKEKLPTVFRSDSHQASAETPEAAEKHWQATTAPAQESDQLELENVAFLFRDYRLALSQLPTGTNAEITAALQGNNLRQLRLPIPENAHINAQGELCDAWKTPYFFHSISSTHIEIRSAGPDRIMGNTDDLSTQSQ
jgi:hypothetical protein